MYANPSIQTQHPTRLYLRRLYPKSKLNEEYLHAVFCHDTTYLYAGLAWGVGRGACGRRQGLKEKDPEIVSGV